MLPQDATERVDEPPTAGSVDGDGREDERAVATSDDPDALSTASTRVPLDEIRRYVAVFNAIREGYVDPVEDKALMMSAIRGLLNDLDPHSAYLDRSAEAQGGTSGAYGGIGVEVMQLPDGKIRVIAPIDGTPAEKAASALATPSSRSMARISPPPTTKAMACCAAILAPVRA